ncbi:MAG: ribonuclease PH [Verrucomicrobiae bacterium]|nr:ribonuclease PH [Verrucomicrobiae bacterium]MCP5539021.1 ribonuclease PH [Akkermansiaceae bacterium]MCP5550592.1 ribonuclease PH [Akkermansiaceae bacterium]
MTRIDGRTPDEVRTVTFQADIAPHATGSVLVSFGNTQVICAVTIEESVPRWMLQQNVPGGWLTAEYSMLPYSTLDRKPRDSSRGRVDGRSTEIQRLIGRSLRAVVDLEALGQRTLWVDCDVLRADGGTRTASITGAAVAAEMAFRRLIAAGKLTRSPLKQLAVAVSTGIFEDRCVLDLNYHEDKDASVDFNYVMTEDLNLIEVQGSGEEATFSEPQMLEMLGLAKKGVSDLAVLQRAALEAFDPKEVA